MILVAGATGMVGGEACRLPERFGIRPMSVADYAREVGAGTKVST